MTSDEVRSLLLRALQNGPQVTCLIRELQEPGLVRLGNAIQNLIDDSRLSGRAAFNEDEAMVIVVRVLDRFMFGGRSNADRAARNVVSELMTEMTFISRVSAGYSTTAQCRVCHGPVEETECEEAERNHQCPMCVKCRIANVNATLAADLEHARGLIMRYRRRFGDLDGPRGCPTGERGMDGPRGIVPEVHRAMSQAVSQAIDRETIERVAEEVARNARTVRPSQPPPDDDLPF